MGCRKLKVVEHYDDLSGTVYFEEELEEMAFVFDGQALVLDLDEKNAAAFRAAMAPFVRKARRTTKSKVLATLPKRPRHLKSLPSPSPEESPKGDDFDEMIERSSLGSPVAKAIQSLANAPQEGRFPQKGQSVEARTEPEGTQVPETAPEPSDSSPSEAPVRPALKVVPPPNPHPIPETWAPYAPELRDDKADRMLKARQWAGQLGMELPDNKVTPEVLERWKGFYKERRWTHLS